MPAHSAAHTRARLQSVFETLVFRAEQDIMAELRHPRVTSLCVNSDRKARYAAAQRLVERGELVVVLPETRCLTHRPPPSGGPLRERLEIRVRLPVAGKDDDEETI